jgi:hypothetical protein
LIQWIEEPGQFRGNSIHQNRTNTEEVRDMLDGVAVTTKLGLRNEVAACPAFAGIGRPGFLWYVAVITAFVEEPRRFVEAMLAISMLEGCVQDLSILPIYPNSFID